MNRISSIASSTKVVVSKLTSRRSPSGSWRLISSILALTSRPTCTALAPRSFVMPKPIDGLAHGAADAPPVLEAVLDHRHVPEAHRRAAPVGDDEVAEGRDVDGLALGAHVHLALGALDAPGRHLQVLARDGAVDVEHREALRLEPRRVVPDAHVRGRGTRSTWISPTPSIVWSCGRMHVADVVGEEGRGPVARRAPAA